MSILYDFAIATFYSLPILFWYRIKLKNYIDTFSFNYKLITYPNIIININKEENCALCISNFTDSKDICIPTCGHAMHLTCFKDLIKSSCTTNNLCPTCKTPLFESSRDLRNSSVPSIRYNALPPTPSPNIPLNNVSREYRSNNPYNYHPSPLPPDPLVIYQLNNPQPYHLRNWHLYSMHEQNIMINKLFETRDENEIMQNHISDGTVIVNKNKLRHWRNYTSNERTIMIRQLFPNY